ncbi:MAG: HAD family hydrolase [Alphaproteobacteria bacterium]|nr:HAD family hydrolase [Alphaproteobacteria bacterium]
MTALSLPPPKAILFDWDGTLVDTMGCVLNGHNAVRRHFGLPEWKMAGYKDTIAHRSSREAYPDLYGPRAPEALEVLYNYIKAHHLADLSLLSGAAALLDFIARSDVPMGVVSNKRHEILQEEVVHLGWRPLFFAIVGAGYVARDKPDPLIFETALAEGGIDVPAGDIWYVGDSSADMDMARNVGCRAVLIGSGDKTKLVETCKPDAVFDSCNGLQNALASCMSRNV